MPRRRCVRCCGPAASSRCCWARSAWSCRACRPRLRAACRRLLRARLAAGAPLAAEEPHLRPMLREWEKHRSVSRRVKRFGLTAMALTAGFSLWALAGRPWLQALVLLGVAVGRRSCCGCRRATERRRKSSGASRGRTTCPAVGRCTRSAPGCGCAPRIRGHSLVVLEVDELCRRKARPHTGMSRVPCVFTSMRPSMT